MMTGLLQMQQQQKLVLIICYDHMNKMIHNT